MSYLNLADLSQRLKLQRISYNILMCPRWHKLFRSLTND